jgi:hypothetical protein
MRLADTAAIISGASAAARIRVLPMRPPGEVDGMDFASLVRVFEGSAIHGDGVAIAFGQQRGSSP